MTAVTITQLILSVLCLPPVVLLLVSPWWEPRRLRRWHYRLTRDQYRPRHRAVSIPAVVIQGPRPDQLPPVEAYAVSGYTGGATA